MIITLFLQFIVGALSALLQLMPQVTTLPELFGIDIDGTLLNLIGQWNSFISYVWPLQIVWTCTLWYFALSVTLSIFRFFFGGRIPRI